MTAPQALLALPLLAALVVGCGGTDPVAERREVVATVTDAANTRDADALRRAADRLVQLVEQQLAAEELPADEAERLRVLAQTVHERADLVDEELQRRLQAEAEAEQARRQLEETQRLLEQERSQAEEAARQAEQSREERGGDEGKGKGDKDEKDDD